MRILLDQEMISVCVCFLISNASYLICGPNYKRSLSRNSSAERLKDCCSIKLLCGRRDRPQYASCSSLLFVRLSVRPAPIGAGREVAVLFNGGLHGRSKFQFCPEIPPKRKWFSASKVRQRSHRHECKYESESGYILGLALVSMWTHLQSVRPES